MRSTGGPKPEPTSCTRSIVTRPRAPSSSPIRFFICTGRASRSSSNISASASLTPST
jgi:hypothetical protein